MPDADPAPAPPRPGSARIQPVASDAQAARACAALIGDTLRAALARKMVPQMAGETGRVGLMVSGGRTPGAVLAAVLARGDLDWDRIDVVASDERLVAPDDPASTEAMVRGLFAQAGRPCHYRGFGPQTGRDIDPEAALAAWRAGIATMAWPPAIGFLGIGEDGHTASLFPGRPEAGDADLRTAAVPQTAPHVAPRLTFGAAALAECRHIVLIANSAAKIAHLDRAMAADADPRALPVAWLCRLPQTRIIRVGP